MTGFEYFTTLLSIILGFSLAGVVRMIGRFLNTSNRTSESWLLFAWNLVLLVQITVYWIVLWRLFNTADDIKFWVLIVYTVGTVILYLASFVLEDKGQDKDGGEALNTGPGRVFFSCLAIHMFLVMAHITAVQGFATDIDAILGWSAFGLCLVGLTLKKLPHHLVLLCVYAVNIINIGLINTVAFTN